MADVLRIGQTVRDTEVIVEQPNGQRLRVVVNIEPIKNEFGDVTGAINCFQDISERKQNTARLRESQTACELLSRPPLSASRSCPETEASCT